MSATAPDPSIPTDLAALRAQLRAWGRAASLPDVQAAYAPWHACAPVCPHELITDVAYGPHARHRCDVYRPLAPSASPRPCLLYLHGGGFVRGDKSMRAALGRWGAAQGWVTVLANYRLAPMDRWPSGPEDVARWWSWWQLAAQRYGGAPTQTVLMGESAGAAHVAAACLMRRFQPTNWAPAGAVLLSGPYDAGLEAHAHEALEIAQPDVRNEAYFGADRSHWAAASIVRQVDAAPPRLLLAWAEMDLLQMQVAGADLWATLARRTDPPPELACWIGHNHFSAGASIGTADSAVADRLAQFLQSLQPKALA